MEPSSVDLDDHGTGAVAVRQLQGDWLHHLLGDVKDRWQQIGAAHGFTSDREIIHYLVEHYDRTRHQASTVPCCTHCQAPLDSLCPKCRQLPSGSHSFSPFAHSSDSLQRTNPTEEGAVARRTTTEVPLATENRKIHEVLTTEACSPSQLLFPTVGSDVSTDRSNFENNNDSLHKSHCLCETHVHGQTKRCKLQYDAAQNSSLPSQTCTAHTQDTSESTGAAGKDEQEVPPAVPAPCQSNSNCSDTSAADGKSVPVSDNSRSLPQPSSSTKTVPSEGSPINVISDVSFADDFEIHFAEEAPTDQGAVNDDQIVELHTPKADRLSAGYLSPTDDDSEGAPLSPTDDDAEGAPLSPTDDTPGIPVSPVDDAPIISPSPVDDAPIISPSPVDDAPVTSPFPVDDATSISPSPVDDVPIISLSPVDDAPIIYPSPVDDATSISPYPVDDAPIISPYPVDDAPGLSVCTPSILVSPADGTGTIPVSTTDVAPHIPVSPAPDIPQPVVHDASDIPVFLADDAPGIPVSPSNDTLGVPRPAVDDAASFPVSVTDDAPVISGVSSATEKRASLPLTSNPVVVNAAPGKIKSEINCTAKPTSGRSFHPKNAILSMPVLVPSDDTSQNDDFDQYTVSSAIGEPEREPTATLTETSQAEESCGGLASLSFTSDTGCMETAGDESSHDDAEYCTPDENGVHVGGRKLADGNHVTGAMDNTDLSAHQNSEALEENVTGGVTENQPDTFVMSEVEADVGADVSERDTEFEAAGSSGPENTTALNLEAGNLGLDTQVQNWYGGVSMFYISGVGETDALTNEKLQPHSCRKNRPHKKRAPERGKSEEKGMNTRSRTRRSTKTLKGQTSSKPSLESLSSGEYVNLEAEDSSGQKIIVTLPVIPLVRLQVANLPIRVAGEQPDTTDVAKARLRRRPTQDSGKKVPSSSSLPLGGNGQASRKRPLATADKTSDAASIFTMAPKRKVLPERSAAGKTLICHECGMGFTSASNLKKHFRVHTGEKPFTCKQCGKSFSQSSHLKLHQRSHTGEKPYLCSVCGTSFIQASGLRIHMGIHSGDKPFSCDFCDAKFLRLGDLNKHLRTHTKHRPFSCKECGAGFTASSALQVHMRIHTGDKPFTCQLCGDAFAHSISLTTHVKCKHGGSRPFECQQCGKAFAWSTDLTKHKRTHTGEKPYQCSFCDRTFARSDHLKVHARKHTGEKPFSCDICGQYFSQAGGVTKHKRKMHA